MPEAEIADVEAESSIAQVVESDVIEMDSEEVVEVVEAEVAETEEVVAEEEAKVEPEIEAPKPQKVPLKRLSKVISERETWKERALKAESQSEAQEITPISTEAKPTMPTVASSGYDQEAFESSLGQYQEDLVDYKIAQRDKEVEQTKVAQAAKDQSTASVNRIEAFLETNEEYQGVLQEIVDNDEAVEYPPAVARAIEISENGPQLDLLILKNRHDLLPRLAQMTPEQQFMEIGILAGSLNREPEKVLTKPKPTTNAPDVIVASTGSARSSSADADMKAIYKAWSIS